MFVFQSILSFAIKRRWGRYEDHDLEYHKWVWRDGRERDMETWRLKIPFFFLKYLCLFSVKWFKHLTLEKSVLSTSFCFWWVPSFKYILIQYVHYSLTFWVCTLSLRELLSSVGEAGGVDSLSPISMVSGRGGVDDYCLVPRRPSLTSETHKQ